MFFFTPDYGLFNTALSWLRYHGPHHWTGNPNKALIAIMTVGFWKSAGYFMIFYLAGLQNLPKEMFETAVLDRANTWHQLRFITFPLLLRWTLFVTTIAFIGAFQTADHIFVLTQGGHSISRCSPFRSLSNLPTSVYRGFPAFRIEIIK